MRDQFSTITSIKQTVEHSNLAAALFYNYCSSDENDFFVVDSKNSSRTGNLTHRDLLSIGKLECRTYGKIKRNRLRKPGRLARPISLPER